MSPRNKPGHPHYPARLFLLVLLLAFLISAPGTAISREANPAGNSVIRFYQSHISPVDGDRCPMTPSCSEYARQAIRKHGPVLGWIMACDRLMRCGRDEVRLAPVRRIKGQPFTFDPVAANDFWWFTPPPEQSAQEGNRP